jgi:DDE family transposase
MANTPLLFDYSITQNWHGKPLVTHQVIVELIAATTTKTGLKVYSRLDEQIYSTGQRILDKRLAAVNMESDAWHGEWNYTILFNTLGIHK